MQQRTVLALVCGLLPCMILCAALPVAQAADPITPEEIGAHIRFLSHDLLEGRSIGSTGGAVAIAYIESALRSAGLQPTFGDSYLQEITLRRVQPDHNASLRFLGHPATSRPLVFGRDFVATCPLSGEPQVISAELLYLGYGIVSERWQWDDYKDVDVRNKVLVMHTNEPRPDLPELFEGKALTHYGRWSYKYAEAARHGALGVILIHTDEDAGYTWEVVRNSWSGAGFFDVDEPDIPRLESWISSDVAAELFRVAGQDLAELRARAQERSFRPVPLGATVELRLHNPTSMVTTYNVAGTAPGSAADHASRTMVLSAHHDHLGRSEEIEGDNIFNGALDNGSALALLLGLARLVGREPGLLRHDVIFFACTAEEEGLLGSAYFVRNPPVPVSQLAANLNFEMTHVWGPTRDMLAIGAEHSELSDIIAEVGARHDMTISPEDAPEQGFFYRSDQHSFAMGGVPATWIDCGVDLVGKPPGTGLELRRQYREHSYHRPSDELDPSWELTGTVQLSGLVLEILQEIDRRERPPQWRPDSPLAVSR